MSNPSIHTEATFKQAIVEHLTSNGWHAGNPDAFDSALALEKATVVDFIQRSQRKEWKQLQTVHGIAVEDRFIQRLVKEAVVRENL